MPFSIYNIQLAKPFMLSSEDFTFYYIRDRRRNAFAKYDKKG